MQPNLSEALIDNIPLPVLAVDKAGLVVDMNAAAKLLLPPDTVFTGKRLDALFPDWGALLTQLKANHGSFRRQVRLDGSRIANVQATPLPSVGWAITLEITTPEEANFLGEVTHDLKQPLAAILSFSDVVQASGELNAKQQQFLDRIRGAASRMSDEVHQLLDVAWIESGMKLTLVEVDLINLVRITLEDLEGRASSKNIKLVVDAPASLPNLIADQNRLGQVITNLVTNAIKYSPEGSTVTLKLRQDTNMLVFSVSDQGMGIAPEHLSKLFQRFFRVPDKRIRQIEGTGLGLYITRSIVEQHGGHVTVNSTPETGSTFSVYLPLKNQLPEAETQPAQSA